VDDVDEMVAVLKQSSKKIDEEKPPPKRMTTNVKHKILPVKTNKQTNKQTNKKKKQTNTTFSFINSAIALSPHCGEPQATADTFRASTLKFGMTKRRYANTCAIDPPIECPHKTIRSTNNKRKQEKTTNARTSLSDFDHFGHECFIDGPIPIPSMNSTARLLFTPNRAKKIRIQIARTCQACAFSKHSGKKMWKTSTNNKNKIKKQTWKRDVCHAVSSGKKKRRWALWKMAKSFKSESRGQRMPVEFTLAFFVGTFISQPRQKYRPRQNVQIVRPAWVVVGPLGGDRAANEFEVVVSTFGAKNGIGPGLARRLRILENKKNEEKRRKKKKKQQKEKMRKTNKKPSKKAKSSHIKQKTKGSTNDKQTQRKKTPKKTKINKKAMKLQHPI
jgi:hypothetical protein